MMSEGRAPWPTFAVDARAALAKRLKPLGLVVETTSPPLAGGPPKSATHVTFSGGGRRVELVYDPWEVDLEVRVDGIWMAQLLERMLPDAMELAPSRQGLVALAEILADLLPRLATAKGKRAAKDARAWQNVLVGDNAVEMRRALHQAPFASIRAAAARRLGSMNPPTAVMARSLARALGDGEPSVRLAAAEALYHRAQEARAAVPALSRVLTDSAEDLRVRALQALRQLGPKAAEARTAVEERVKRGGARERRLAAEVMAAMAGRVFV